MLIEKYAGAFPFWICPTQVKVLSLTDRTADYATEIAEKLRYAGLRAEADTRSEKLGYKIREAQRDKIPYMFIVGDKEKEDGTVSVRSRKDGEQGAEDIDTFLAKILEEIKAKAL